MRKFLLICAVLSSLSSCTNSGNRIQELERENAALRAERDVLKAGAVQARGRAVEAAAEAYARRCATALTVISLDSPDMTIPREISGKSCADEALGVNALEPSLGVATSTITLDETGERYTIEVVDTAGQMTTKKF